uniref:Uncharacterized protein n=1 Tax=Klebsiella pneumoniae TaxID=573 RepID=A0A8B0SUP6_KLEPN|nr:hypothetical protein [Klebsiella pneumoniae]
MATDFSKSNFHEKKLLFIGHVLLVCSPCSRSMLPTSWRAYLKAWWLQQIPLP